MVNRIPGFSIEDSEGRRGFGENAGNVLIDGDRPSTKADDIFTLLSRIPASQVDYIGLTEAAGGDGEARGKAQIVNVVRKKSNKVSGTYEAFTTLGQHHDVTPHGNASASFRRGASTFDVNANYFREDVRGRGPELFYDGKRSLQEGRYYRGHGGYQEMTLGGAIKTRMGSTKINANTKLSWADGFDDRLGLITSPLNAPVGIETLVTRGPQWDFGYEIGGDIEFPLAPKLTTKLIGLWRDNAENELVTVDTDFLTAADTGFSAFSTQKPSEAIFRIQNDWTGIKSHAIQFGGEFAYNRLDAAFRQTSRLGGALTQLPASNVVVSEVRFEPFLSDVWSISPAWKVEAGLIYERSSLKLTGDSQAKRTLSFIKPKVIATWTVDPLTTMEFKAIREVAQLDFDDFATSVDLSVGNQVDAGNSDLVPEQTTTFAALIRRKFFERGSIQFNAEYQLLKDTQDLVPVTIRDAMGNVTARFDGVGNIGNSKRWNLELEITLPFDWLTKPIGVTGLEVKYVGHYHGSRVTDPVTGLNRRISNRPEWHQEWNVRHDLGKSGFAWGGKVFAHAPVRQYFVNQFRQFSETPNVELFAEYKKFKFGTIRLKLFDVTRYRWHRDRLFYRDTRATGDVNGIIERVRRFDRRIQLSLSGKF